MRVDYDDKESVARLILSTPIHRFLGYRLLWMKPDTGELCIEAAASGNADRYRGEGLAHGGAVATLIDSTATYVCCVYSRRQVPTMNLRVDFLRPAVGERMQAHARIRRAGKSVATVDVDVECADKLVAIGRANLAMSALPPTIAAPGGG